MHFNMYAKIKYIGWPIGCFANDLPMVVSGMIDAEFLLDFVLTHCCVKVQCQFSEEPFMVKQHTISDSTL